MLLFLSLHKHTSLARTKYALLEHISRSNDLSQRVWLGSLRQRHLEHRFVDIRVEIIAHNTVLHSIMKKTNYFCDSLGIQHLVQLLLGHYHTLVKGN